MYRTTEFSIAPSVSARLYAGQWLERRWWFLVLPVVCCAIAGLYDLRWFIVGLIFLLTVWPAALFFVWTGRVLEPDVVRASMPHSICFDGQGMTICYTLREGYPLPPDEFLAWEAVDSYTMESKRVVFSSGRRRIIVPSEMFDSSTWQKILSARGGK